MLITVTTGVETQALRVQDSLVERLMANLSDYERARSLTDSVKAQLILSVMAVSNLSLAEAVTVVESETEVAN